MEACSDDSPTRSRFVNRIALLLATSLALPPARAQSIPSSAAPAASAADDEIVTLDEFIVRESALAASGEILPTSRPVLSVFGSESILETPRSVTVLTPELMRQFDIQDFSDLARLGAGTQQANYYGIAGIPTLRGAQGGVYFNGMQRAYQRNEMPLSFGSLEGMDLVKGPAPAHFGAALVGGYVNLLPKSPYYAAPRREVTVELGQHDSYRAQLDVGAPTLLFDKPAAYRVSVTTQLADSSYDRVGNDFVSVYAALKSEVARDVTLFTGGEFFGYRSNENAGWNRPTQELIDSGRYVVGEPVSIASSAWGGLADRSQLYAYSPALVVPAGVVDAAVAAGTITATQRAAMNDLATVPGRTAAYGGTLPGPEIAATTSGYQYTDAYIDGPDGLRGTGDDGLVFTTPIDGDTVLSDEADFADSTNVFWFADLESRRHPDRTVKNQVIVDYIRTDKRSSYGYAFESEQIVLEDKLSLTEDLDFLDTRLTYGASARYTDAWQLQDFWDEPFSRRDISADGISGNSVVHAGGVHPANPSVNYWTQFGQGGNYESRLLQLSAFAYAESRLTERLRLHTSLLAAYAPFTVGTPSEAGAFPSDRHDQTYTGLGLSPSYRINEYLVAYVTLQTGTALDPFDGGPIVGRASFAENELAETGLKGSFLDGRLYAGLSAYTWRQGSFSARDAVAEELEGRGIELETTYAPNRHFSLLAAVGFQRVTLEGDSQPFRASGLTEADWALNGGVLNNNFAPVGDGSASNNPDRIYPGTPETQIKLFAAYTFNNGFGLSGGPVWSDAYWHNFDRTLRLPATIVVHGSVYYRRPTWDLTLAVENLTDEDYFTGAEPIFGAGTILTKAPSTQFKLTYAYRF